MKNPSRRSAALPLAALALLTSLPALKAADVIKANNATALNLVGSWVSGTVPTSADIAVWDSTITANRITAIGADLAFGGIKISNTGSAATLMTISGSNIHTLTLGSSGIDMSAANSNLTISANLALGASQAWNVASGRLLTLQTGTISGSAALTLAGSGTIALSGNTNTYSGGTTLNAGVHVLINSSSALLTPFGSGTVAIGNNVQIAGASTGNRYITNAVVLNGDVTLGSSTVQSNMFLTGGIDVGSGTSTINILNPNAPGGANAALSISGSGKSISGTGGGTLVIANGNAGTSPEVWVRMGASLEPFTVTSDLTIGSNVNLYFATSNILGADCGLTVQSGGTFDLSNKGGSAINQTIQSLAGAGTVTSGRTSAALSGLTIDGGAGTGTTNFSGNIVTGTAGASISVTKTGSTTQIFSGSNNYVGQTQVNAGTLLINGVHAAPEALGNGFGNATTGRFQVESGAVLGGSGRINVALSGTASGANNAIYVKSGGILAPGASIGVLKLDAAGFDSAGGNDAFLNMAAGADFAFELAGDGTSADQIEMWNYASGDLLLNANEINLTLSGPLVAGTYNVTIFEFYSDSGTTLMSSGIASGLAIGTLGTGISAASITYNSAGGTITLQYTVVPEPATLTLLMGGLGVAVLFRRRRSVF